MRRTRSPSLIPTKSKNRNTTRSPGASVQTTRSAGASTLRPASYASSSFSRCASIRFMAQVPERIRATEKLNPSGRRRAWGGPFSSTPQRETKCASSADKCNSDVSHATLSIGMIKSLLVWRVNRARSLRYKSILESLVLLDSFVSDALGTSMRSAGTAILTACVPKTDFARRNDCDALFKYVMSLPQVAFRSTK